MKTVGNAALIGTTLCIAVSTAFAMDTHSAVSALHIPAATAHVADAYPTHLPVAPEYVLIQDLHRHPEVQQHIADILLQVYRRWGVRQVLVEGAFSEVPIVNLGALSTDEREIDRTRELQSGQLTGAELAAEMIATRETHPDQYLQLQGIEDPTMYAAHLEVYRVLLAQRSGVLAELGRIEVLQKEMQLPGDHPLVQQLQRVRDLIQLKMTPRTYAAYLAQKAFSPSSVLLTEALANAERFYQLTDERSDVFLRNADARAATQSGPRVMVVGGFHTEGLARRLREQGRSYVVLAPTVTRGGYENLYEKRMIETVSALQIANSR